MENRCDVLYIVIPCYNEQAVLAQTAAAVINNLRQMVAQGLIHKNSKLVFVDDGSTDQTWQMIQTFHQQNDCVQGISLSKNSGHQNALLAGLLTVREFADMVISLDADLQDDIEVIPQFVKEYYNGFDVVYGVRSTRKTDGRFKRLSARSFYKLMHHMGVEIVYDHADYRLMSKRAIDSLAEFKEVNLFLRGIVPLIGFKTTTVSYERHSRAAGESKYPLKKMLSFAFDGITSFSIRPIRMITALGLLIFLCSIIMLIYFLVIYLSGNTVSGWTSTIISVWAIGGLELLSIGVVGEYIGKIYLETKHRPRFIVDQYLK